MQCGPKSLGNITSTLMNLYSKELRQLRRQKRVYSIKHPLSVYTGCRHLQIKNLIRSVCKTRKWLSVREPKSVFSCFLLWILLPWVWPFFLSAPALTPRVLPLVVHYFKKTFAGHRNCISFGPWYMCVHSPVQIICWSALVVMWVVHFN